MVLQGRDSSVISHPRCFFLGGSGNRVEKWFGVSGGRRPARTANCPFRHSRWGFALAIAQVKGNINYRLDFFDTEQNEQRFTPFWGKNAPKSLFYQQYNQSFCLSSHRTTVGRVGNCRPRGCAKSVLRGKNGDESGWFYAHYFLTSLESIMKYKKNPLCFIIFRYICPVFWRWRGEIWG